MKKSEEIIEMMVEIPRGSRNKYEYDAFRDVFRLDRVLYSSVHYPTDYGRLPESLAEDGDPLDIMVMVEEPTFPGCVIPARPIAVLHMIDQGVSDFKILAVPAVDPRFDDIHDLDDVSSSWLREIEYFFDIYKVLEGKTVVTVGWSGKKRALEVIAEARQRYQARLDRH